MAVLWLPPLILQGRPFVTNVLLYSGHSFPRQWGPVAFAHALGAPEGLISLYISPGRVLLLALCAAAGTFVAWRRPDLVVAAIGFTMAAFLLLSPGYAPQYMVWPVAAIYALSFWPATVYNLGTGAFLIALYTAWSGGLPWDHTFTVDLTTAQQWQAAVIWGVLAWVVIDGGRTLLRHTGGLTPGRSRPPAVSATRPDTAQRIAPENAPRDPALRR